MPLGLYSVTEFFAHPQCQNCPQPLHILAYKGGQPPSGSAMASDIAGIIQTILQLKERIQRELGSDCQVLFVPPIRALVVQEENFRSHGALHDACEKNQAFCTNAAMLSVLRDFYNSFSAVWMTFMLKEPFYEPIRTSLKNYKAVIREENVVPVLDSKNYTLEMEPWIQMLQTVIEQLLSNNKMRKEIDMPLANPTFEVSSRETVSRVNCVVVVGLDFLWKDLKVSLGDKAQKVHFIHEDINFSTESREKFICLQEKFPDGTRWIILSSLALLFREVPSGQVLCDLYSCPKPLRFYDCMINMNLPCHALNKETESLVSNLVSQVKAFVRSARQFLRPHSELYIPPLSPLAAMVIGNRTSHSHIHTLNEAGAPVHFIYGRFLFWSRTHILLSKKWMEMILKSEEGSDLHNPILKYMDERIPAMSFVYSIQSMKRTAQARTKWISLIEELLLNRTDRESVQSLEVATNAQDSCSTSLENTDTSSDHRPSSGFAMQIHHPVSQSRCLEDSANDSSTKNNAEVKPTNGRKNPSPGKQATLDGASGSSSLTSMQNIKNEIHDSDVPFNNISVDNANHICVSKIKSEFLPMKQKSVVIQQEYYSSIFDRSKSQDLAVNSLTEENIKTVKHKLSCVSTSKSEVFEEFRELDAVTGKNLNVQENKDLVGDENLNEMSTPEGVKLFSTVNATSIINTCRGVELSSMVDATSESNSCRGVELSSTVNAKSVSNTSRGVELSSTVDTASVSSICRDLNDKNKEFITDKDDSSSNAHAQDVLRKAKEISISEDQVPISKKVSVLECVSSNTVLSDAHETNLEPVNDKATNSSCLKEKNLPIKDLSAVNNKDRLPLAQAASPREAFDQVPTESMARVNDEMEMQVYREGPATASTSSLLHKNDTDNLIVLKHANLLKCEDNIKTLSKKKCCSSTLFLPGGDDITDETVISRTSLQTLDYAMDARKTSSGSSRNRDKIDADYALPRENSKSSLDSAMANDSFPSENNNSSLESTTANDSVPNENNISLEGTTANNSVPRENKNSTLEITTICNLPAEEKGKSSISSVSVMNKQMESAIASGREIEQRDTNIPTSTPLNKISSYIPYNKINISITLSEKNRCDEIYRAEQEHTNVTLNNDCSSRGSGNGTSQTVVKGKEISLVEPDKQNQVVNQGMNIPSLINRVPTLPLLSASSYLSTKSSMPTCVVHPIPVILGPVKQKKEKSQVKKEVAISGVSSKPTRRRCPGNFAEPPQGTLTTSSDNFHESWDNSPMDQSVQSVPSNESFSNLSLVQQKFSENGSHALVATTLAISPCTTTHSSIARDATIPIAMNTTYTIPEPPLNTYNKSSRLADLVAPFTIGSTPLKNSSLSFPGSPSAVITLTNFKKSFENEEDVAVSNDNKKRECKIITDKKVDKPTFGLIILNVSTSITINQMKQILEVFGPVESFGRPVNILGKPAGGSWH
ncbi:hypothetical protein SK128_019257 [Halocaridina rubra]|uniref:Uncharacterized protein n=1 Tax=Halocaridina rubra TaxID=373956 RepID=A0AAN9ADY9_HALRR